MRQAPKAPIIVLEPDGPPADLDALAQLLADVVRAIITREQAESTDQQKAA